MQASSSENAKRTKTVSRRHQRHATFQDVAISGSGTAGCVARLVELSKSGAVLADFDTRGLMDGARLTLTLIDGTELDAHVVRSGDRTAVEFEIYLLDADEYLHFEHLGADAFRRISNLQSKRFIASTTRLQKA